jgi:Arc/MetJ-type ribon-helix-helix transcriptional regulator
MTLRISVDLQRRLQAKVDAGEIANATDFVEKLLRDALANGGEETDRGATPEQREQQVVQFFADLDRFRPPEMPVLPDEALTREAIYDDRI